MDRIITLFPVELPDEDAAHLLQGLWLLCCCHTVCPLGSSSGVPQTLGSWTGGGTSWQDNSSGLSAFLGCIVELSVQGPGLVSRAVLK